MQTYRGEILAGTKFVGNDRAKAGEFDGRTGTVTGEHVVSSAFVGGFAVSHRTTYGDFVRNLSGMFEIFTEMDAWDLGLDALERAAIFEGCVWVWGPKTLDEPFLREDKCELRFWPDHPWFHKIFGLHVRFDLQEISQRKTQTPDETACMNSRREK